MNQKEKESNPKFEPGQIVHLKSNPSVKGAVIEVLRGKPEDRYKVFVDGGVQTFYESQLCSEEGGVDYQKLLSEQFHAYLTALQVRYPGLSTLYSLNAARIDYIPYQFRPVMKFIRSDRPRLLIADGVGVGKTIEAGLILRELQARRDVQSILIICPKPLVTENKWLNEMKRFDERFEHLDGRMLMHCVTEMDKDGVWPDNHQKVIIPYSLFDEALLFGTDYQTRRRFRKGLLDLDPPPRFDLVIVDEAHHIRNQDTFSHKAVRFFCDNAEAVVFTTATPVQLGSNDLFVLLNTLRPDLIIDTESFSHMAEPNPFINRAVDLARSQEPEWETQAVDALEKAASTTWGQRLLRYSPEFNQVKNRIFDGNISPKERVQLINDLEGLHTFSGIINRTRRRDIGEFTVRKPMTVSIDFSSSQQFLHNELLDIQSEIFMQRFGNPNVKFMMTTIRRQAASCIFGLAPFLEDILNRHIDQLAWAESDGFEETPSVETVEKIESRIRNLLEKAQALEPPDPKLDALGKIIRDKQSLPNNKIMVFSSFRHTLHYLNDHLIADGFRVALVHGGTPDEDRRYLRRRFEKSKEDNDAIDVLLFSEIGCEGLDYQFCDCIVNYDLPWNPMRIEQRIGRIDRVGQKSETVTIYNMITPGTVDADIYERCLLRIGVFNSAIGGSEEILGEITKEIHDIAEDFNLSDDARNARFQQLADNKIRLIQEQEELEQRQFELFGIHLPQEQMQRDIEAASSFWLKPEALQRLINHYLQEIGGKEQDYILGEKSLKTLRLSQELRSNLLLDFQKLQRKPNVVYREWENYLKGSNPHFPITFDAKCASENHDIAFITIQHPLVKQAAWSFDKHRHVFASLKAISHKVPQGRYEIAIYQWRLLGIKEDLILQPVASSESVTPHLPALLEIAENMPDNSNDQSASIDIDALDAQHHTIWETERDEHCRQAKKIVEFQRESLTTSHRARRALLEEQLNSAENEKIRKMRQSQINSADADYKRRMNELDNAAERADITADPVAYGVIYIEGEKNNDIH